MDKSGTSAAGGVASEDGPDATPQAASPAADLAQDAEYIAQMTVSLSRLAHRSRFEFLGYLLEMCALEADAVSTRIADDDPQARRSNRPG